MELGKIGKQMKNMMRIVFKGGLSWLVLSLIEMVTEAGKLLV